MRRRNGAYFWELFHDSADPSRFIECFMDESWVEHLRQHERVSVADREIQQRAKRSWSKASRRILALARGSATYGHELRSEPYRFGVKIHRSSDSSPSL